MAAAATREVRLELCGHCDNGVIQCWLTRRLLPTHRYLEFNLLYDRGVKFGLANVNPRVEGVMVSAPPLIAWEYNHKIEEGSEEERLMKILKKPKDWTQ